MSFVQAARKVGKIEVKYSTKAKKVAFSDLI
jgi:hypothetical protein